MPRSLPSHPSCTVIAGASAYHSRLMACTGRSPIRSNRAPYTALAPRTIRPPASCVAGGASIFICRSTCPASGWTRRPHGPVSSSCARRGPSLTWCGTGSRCVCSRSGQSRAVSSSRQRTTDGKRLACEGRECLFS
eukprot:5788229-Prymnesium_polylepis.1